MSLGLLNNHSSLSKLQSKVLFSLNWSHAQPTLISYGYKILGRGIGYFVTLSPKKTNILVINSFWRLFEYKHWLSNKYVGQQHQMSTFAAGYIVLSVMEYLFRDVFLQELYYLLGSNLFRNCCGSFEAKRKGYNKVFGQLRFRDFSCRYMIGSFIQ